MTTPGNPAAPLSQDELAHTLALDEWNKMVQNARGSFGAIKDDRPGRGGQPGSDDDEREVPQPVLERRNKDIVHRKLQEEIESKKQRVTDLEREKDRADAERVARLEKEIADLRERNQVFEMMYKEMVETPGNPDKEAHGHGDDEKQIPAPASDATPFTRKHAAALQLLSTNPSCPIPKRFILNHVDDQQIYTVGRQRGAVDLWLDSERTKNFISRIHAQFEFTKHNTWLLTDRNSVNGMFINGVKVHSRALKHGDVITFGGAAELKPGDRVEPNALHEFRYVFTRIRRPTLDTDSDNDDGEAGGKVKKLEEELQARDYKQQLLEKQNQQLERKITQLARQKTVPFVDSHGEEAPADSDDDSSDEEAINPFERAATRQQSGAGGKKKKKDQDGRMCATADNDYCSVM